MANNRYISTDFWKDTYVAELDPSEKLVFLYLLTNPKTNIAGIYEVNVREIAFDTGFDVDMIKKILGRFERDGKIQHQQGWINMRNWIKHQALNPSVKAGIARVIEKLPPWLSDAVKYDERTGNILISETGAEEHPGAGTGQPVDSLGTGSDILNSTLLNSTLLNLTKPNAAAPTSQEAGEVADRRSAKTKQIDGMFEYWETKVGLKITARVKQNREYAGKLLSDYSKEDIAQLIQAAALASEDRYAPRVVNFIDLYRKADDLKHWGKKHFTSKSKSGSTVIS